MIRAFYSLALWLAQPLLRRKLRRRAVAEPGYAQHVPERFGRYSHPAGGGYLWLHAVSLGETRAAAILLAQLRQHLPQMRLLLTHGTATGRAEGAKLLRPGDVQVWQPWDTPAATRRFVRHFQPVLGVLMETEVWPNLTAACRAQGVPLVLANARLSEKSLRSAQRLGWLARPAYRALAAAYAQTHADAQRLRRLGAPVHGVFGNLKFDAAPDPAQLAQGRAWRAAHTGVVLLLASSREGEEALWLQEFQKKMAAARNHQAQAAINSGACQVRWLIVPRHPQRFDEVQALLQSAGLRVARRSQWGSAPPPDADVWLGDTLGEMALYYGLAHVALLGGSFAPLGGQNLIEAAACGCPVVLGPHTFNFAEAAHNAVAAAAAVRVATMAEGVAAATQLACSAQALAQAQTQALAFARQHAGASAATASALVALVPHA